MKQPFLIIFTARSGSTAIYGDLANHPEVTMLAEIFGYPVLPDNSEQNDDNRIKYWHEYYAPFKPGADGPAPEKSKGFKFQIGQFDELPRFAKVISEYNTKVIVLRRKSLIHQLISSLNAKRLMSVPVEEGVHNSAHVRKDQENVLSSLAKEKFVVDIPQMKNRLANLKKTYAVLDKLAANFPDALEITYEDYLHDRMGVLTKIAEHIGVDASKFSPEPAYKKITDTNLEQVVKNYPALKRFAENNGMSI